MLASSLALVLASLVKTRLKKNEQFCFLVLILMSIPSEDSIRRMSVFVLPV